LPHVRMRAGQAADNWYPADAQRRACVDAAMDWHHSTVRRGVTSQARRTGPPAHSANFSRPCNTAPSNRAAGLDSEQPGPLPPLASPAARTLPGTRRYVAASSENCAERAAARTPAARVGKEPALRARDQRAASPAARRLTRGACRGRCGTECWPLWPACRPAARSPSRAQRSSPPLCRRARAASLPLAGTGTPWQKNHRLTGSPPERPAWRDPRCPVGTRHRLTHMPPSPSLSGLAECGGGCHCSHPPRQRQLCPSALAARSLSGEHAQALQDVRCG
jgi:hypothetical protein